MVLAAVAHFQEATELYSSVSPAVCSLVSDTSSATGFFVADGKYLITAYHFVEDAKEIAVSAPGVRVLGVLYASDVDDVAILAVSGTPKHSLTLVQELPRIGERVFAIGNSLGVLENTLSDGLVSGIRQLDEVKLIQFTAPVSPGNSGGPVVNSAGGVVGMVSFQLGRGQNVNFAVSADTIRTAIEGVSPNDMTTLAEMRENKIALLDTNALFFAWSNLGAGFIDSNGKWIIPPLFDDVSDFVSGRSVASKNDQRYLIDRTGRIIYEFPESYSWIGPFSEGLAPVYNGEKLGYINLDGQIVIDFDYDWVDVEFIFGTFQSGLAVVQRNGKMGAINSMGRVVIPIEFDYIWDFSDGAALAMRGNQEGAINTSGRFIFHDSADIYILDSYANGLAPAVSGKLARTGYIDKRGNWAIQPEFDFVTVFDGVYAAVAVDELVGFIDRQGAVVIEPAFPFPEDYEQRFTGRFETEESLCWVPLDEDHFGFIDKTGEVVISGDFVYADDFRNGLALVVTEDHIGYINTKGDWIYQISLDELYPDGLLSAVGF